MNKIKFINALKNNFKLQLAIFLMFLSYIFLKFNDKYMYIYILSLIYFSYRLMRIYYNKFNDRIKIMAFILLDITYTLLYTFSLKYIVVYILACILIIYLEDRKRVYNKSLKLAIESIIVYTIFKIIVLISMILI